MTTCAPAAASTRAVASPRPLAPPVTIAEDPFSSMAASIVNSVRPASAGPANASREVAMGSIHLMAVGPAGQPGDNGRASRLPLATAGPRDLGKANGDTREPCAAGPRGRPRTAAESPARDQPAVPVALPERLRASAREPVIAVDAMGGDYAPDEIVAGALAAQREHGVTTLLTGPPARLRPVIARLGGGAELRVVPAEDVVGMGEGALAGFRRPRSSIAVACQLVRAARRTPSSRPAPRARSWPAPGTGCCRSPTCLDLAWQCCCRPIPSRLC